MYFKRLEIFGFKSFADKTVMNFGPGITAVVGPNGCGKSNVFDSIRWVLGEQSVKELRGASMEDVIFNGTEKKPSLGFAEVSVTFANENRALPVDYNEVTVTRRLFRSGESEYLLNKTPVRLRDINELFMGTGIGAEAYSLVQQGKVDLVVSARPEDRRVILDEASGITKYKSKRKEALGKLRDTENNLLRINDIITEVKRQISSLERQANKARRFKEEFEELKKLETQFAAVELDELKDKGRQVREHVAALRAREFELTEEMKDFHERLDNETQFMEELDEKINEVMGDNIKIDGQLDLCQRQIEFNEERIENILTNQKRVAEQRGQIKERCRVQEEKMQELKASLLQLDNTVQERLDSLRAREVQLKDVADRAEQDRGHIREEEDRILDITAQQVQVRNRLTEVMKEVQGGLARKRRLEMEDAKVNQEKEGVDQKFREICQKAEEARQKITALRADRETQGGRLKQLREELLAFDGMIDDLEKKKLFLKSQKEFIEKLRVQYQDIPDPVVTGRFITGTSPMPQHTGIIGKVKDVIVLEGDRLARLREDLYGDSEKLYEIVCETKFIELDPQQISAKIEELDRDITRYSADRERFLSDIHEQEQSVDHVDSQIQDREKELSIFEAQKTDAIQENSKLTEELDLVHIELDEVNGTLESLKQSEGELSGNLDVLSQELSVCQLRIQDCQKAMADHAREREETTITIAQLQSQINAEKEKRQSYLQNLTLYAETVDSGAAEIRRLAQEDGALEEKHRQYEAEILQLNDQISGVRAQKASLEGIMRNYEGQKDEVLKRINSVRVNITAYTSDIETLKNTIHQEQFSEQEIAFKSKEIKDRLLQSYKIDFEAVMGPETAALPVPDKAELLAAIERLRKRCEAFGSVNLIAIDEFEELKGRFEFLTKQQSDLIAAKSSLQQTIMKINRQTRQMFMDTFTKVSEEFRIYFRMLFGGGEAQLILLDPENVLESGIDIIARPPGKKLQNISLLSGGEKTLTAIALIFGVFKVNPSPFCVLDEIDAALDESNVGRFSYLLQDFAKIAQFIVITHNKKTISSAQVMYGITMQETGVSRVVSVKFSEKETEELSAVPAGA